MAAEPPAVREPRDEARAGLKPFDVGNNSCRLSMPRASVLVPLFVRGGRLHVWMTSRSQALRTGAGEVCFPGGKRDPQDRDEVDTATREAEEEIGLPTGQVEVVCALFPVVSELTGLLVTPVVGFVEESFCPCPNPAEVSSAFAVPLDFFLRGKDHFAIRPPGRTAWIHKFNFVDPESGNFYHIWGLTATMAILVAVLALRKKPEFAVGFDTENPLPFFQQSLDRCTSKL
ncbi:peroxisomal coenzyme A diphosphatase NUDT7 [Lampris incognitus]|uniref:peroxisomal coenzyme A diphosphatase NUDT7 n=1 Tax=Lampris incognitus TaxID=2546036 RepID=UPI0024B5979A|nr:peroxisomal coenzyme A diphosphatase NUDT7 [Lampris incognitus]